MLKGGSKDDINKQLDRVLMAFWLGLLKTVWAQQSAWKRRYLPCRQQRNSHDCGLHSFYNAVLAYKGSTDFSNTLYHSDIRTHVVTNLADSMKDFFTLNTPVPVSPDASEILAYSMNVEMIYRDVEEAANKKSEKKKVANVKKEAKIQKEVEVNKFGRSPEQKLEACASLCFSTPDQPCLSSACDSASNS